MDASFVCGKRIACPYGKQGITQGAEDQDRGEDDHRVQNVRARLDVLAILERDVKIGKHETEPEVRAPGKCIPMVDDAEGVVAEAFPWCLDLHDHDDTKEDQPTVLQLHGNGPENTC